MSLRRAIDRGVHLRPIGRPDSAGRRLEGRLRVQPPNKWRLLRLATTIRSSIISTGFGTCT